MPLSEIPVVVAGDASSLSGHAAAVLREIAGLLERLVRTGDGGAVDLKSLPFTPADRLWLLERLGQGEVDIRLDIGGRSRIAETGYPGVWWVEHRNEEDVPVSEFIEVNYVPELLSAHPDDVESGLAQLEEVIAELS